MRQSARNYKRVVIKIGSSLFFSEREGLDNRLFSALTEQINRLTENGKEVIVVSSGAIALGMALLHLKSRPKELPVLQACAAVGQNALMDNYSRMFQAHGIRCGQVLLTWDDFNDRTRSLNAKNTLLTLLKFKCVPIINENDAVSTDEIKLGDNDQLSARVASSLVAADLLIILSDVDGLLDRDKNLVRRVDEITPQIKALACPTSKKTCIGGMITKIEAARICVESGFACVIAHGRQKSIITDIVADPQAQGDWTLFVPKARSLAARKRWIAFGTKPKGAIIIDEGAKSALLNKKSLLAVGVVAVEGTFASGDTVSVVTTGAAQVATGKVGISSRTLAEIKGKRFDKEVIHRDNIVIVNQ
ncbi:MAG TPA: glutamate 5-kinase [Patescibacteria group bacterium]|nr:glutamate 5-kinase [Patescibacteria group bacterium]